MRSSRLARVPAPSVRLPQIRGAAHRGVERGAAKIGPLGAAAERGVIGIGRSVAAGGEGADALPTRTRGKPLPDSI